MDRNGGKFQEYPDLQNAIRALSSVCDGAVTHDGHGYNGRDASFMNSIARQSSLTPKQACIAHKVLKTYRNQLSHHGISYDSIPVPEDYSASADDRGNAEEKKDMQQKQNVAKQHSKTARKCGGLINISFAAERNEFYDVLAKIKSLAGRRFDTTTRTWSAPATKTAVESLIEWGFDVDPELKSLVSGISEKKAMPEISIDGMRPYPFQLSGVQFIETNMGRVLIGDEMGLGKTIQALLYLRLHPEIRPAVIICPASLKINWYRETKKWLGETPHIIYGKNNVAAYKNKKIIIINYDILESHQESISEMNPKVVIMDEVHYIKNPTAKRTKASKILGKSVDKVIGLSGTPITNRPIEFFSFLNIVRPDIFSGRFQFAMKYCGAKHNGFGWDFNGASNIEELHKLLTDTVMIRRLKSEVLKELPLKQRSVVPIQIENRGEYTTAETDLLSWIEDNEGKEAAERAGRAEVLTRFEKLKQLAVMGKMNMVYDWVDDFLESGQKLVLFATHHDTVDLLSARYKDVCVKVDGRDSAEHRQRAVDSFQNNADVRLFIGNIKAAGVGLTLTAASNVAFVELDWVPGNHDQAEDRVHRIGQESDSINAYYLIAEQTIEEDIIDILDKKRKVLDAVLDGKESDDSSILRELMNKYKAA